MKKSKAIKLLQRIAIVVLTLVFGVSCTGAVIALENADAINSALGTASFELVSNPDAANMDTEYYKSDYDSLASLIDAGAADRKSVV